MDLRYLVGGPGGKRLLQRLADWDPIGVVTADLAEPLEADEETVDRRCLVFADSADVEHDHRLGPQAHRLQHRGLQLDVRGGGGAHALVLGVQHRVLAWMEGEAKVRRPGSRAKRRQRRPAFLDLTVEAIYLGMAAVGDEARGHSVHPHVLRPEVVEDRPQALQRDAQVRPRLPAPGVVRGKAAETGVRLSPLSLRRSAQAAGRYRARKRSREGPGAAGCWT